MSKVKMLRVFVNQRLTAAAEEIFELFERTILEYEEQLCGSKESQHKQLDSVYNSEVLLHRSDVRQQLVSQEDIPQEQQDGSSSLKQEDPSDLPHIKEEKEEQWNSQEGKQFQGLEEANISMLIFTPTHVKREEDDEEKARSSQLHENQTEENRDTEHVKTEADGEGCGGLGPDRDFNPDGHLHPVTYEETPYSESHTDDGNDLKVTRESNSDLNPLQGNDMPEGDQYRSPGKTSVSSSESATNSGQKEQRNHNLIKNKPISCSVCEKGFCKKKSLSAHMLRHTKGKGFSCSICTMNFPWRGQLVEHMRIHTGEKPFSCSVCKASFHHKTPLVHHMRIHTGEKPFCCSVCSRSFTQKSSLLRHIKVHTGEKPFSCSVCSASFRSKTNLIAHMRIHTGDKPFGCDVCGKKFTERGGLTRHAVVHTGERPFSCSVCGKRYSERRSLKRHLVVHTQETFS